MMKEKREKITAIRSAFITVVLILAASTVAILSKILLPSEVNIEDFNSIFVTLLGFPAVASMYFIMIYTHNALVTKQFAKQASLTNTQIGLRFGICFAMVYFLGMQEVVVEASPFPSWGIDFIVYQFFMGIGEAIAALLLCIAISKFAVAKTVCVSLPRHNSLQNRLSLVVFITIAFTIERAVCYETGLISSNVDTFPVPTYAWTVIFGTALGVCVITLLPIFDHEKRKIVLCSKIVLITIGLSWMLFNIFIGLIYKDTMFNLIMRSGLDVIAVFFAALIGQKLLIDNNKY